MIDVTPAPAPRIACIGGAVFDRKYSAKNALVPATSNPVHGFRSHGGVARNVAENLARLDVAVSFVSIVGDDEAGRALMDALGELGVDTSHVAADQTRPTAEYIAILDPQNDLALGLADMDIFDLLVAGAAGARLAGLRGRGLGFRRLQFAGRDTCRIDRAQARSGLQACDRCRVDAEGAKTAEGPFRHRSAVPQP